jgi:anti-sigma B factor antagonist
MAGDNDIPTVRPSGRIMGEQTDRLKAELKRFLDAGAAEIVLDLADARSIDSMAIGVLVATSNTLRARGGTLRVVDPSEEIRTVLRFFRLDKSLTIEAAPGVA